MPGILSAVFDLACGRAFVAVNWSRCSGETSSSGKTSRTRIASSSCSTTTCGANTHDEEQEKSARRFIPRAEASVTRDFVTNDCWSHFLKGKSDISGDLCSFRRTDRFSIPIISTTVTSSRYSRRLGFGRSRLHDLRHTFGSLLIQSGASIVYVKEQMGHSSIQVTVDIYGHLIPGANVSFVDWLDGRSEVCEGQLRNKTQPRRNCRKSTNLRFPPKCLI